MKLNPALKQVNFIIQQELKHLSGLYPYDLKKFFDPRLIHFANIFTFLKDAGKLPESFMERLINLVAGIELLSIGANHHDFNIGDFIKFAEGINTLGPGGKTSAEESKLKIKLKEEKSLFKSDRNYTVDLLFGDIFYSRAVIYLLKYGDHYIFESILSSLKAVHKNRLILHQRLAEVSNNIKRAGSRDVDFETGFKDLLEDNMVTVLGLNSLYKTSFLIGWGLFAGTDMRESGNANGNPDAKLSGAAADNFVDNTAIEFAADTGINIDIPGGIAAELQFPYEAINAFILIKALNDLAGFFKALPGEYFFLKKIKYMSEKKAQIRNRLGVIISGFKQDWIAANFKSLEKLYL
jgi:hypothetical protein